ncbi:MAG: sigma 54-interacting transcriptional regulator [Gammaproteobacteria bacterium]|jgi:DNA-binding NtrC family response regulator|nr:sigma 54-interacting transcriptional regulator [Gammaproteobacteria bacterium]
MNDQHLIGSTPELARVLNAARMVAPTDATVLILGEIGSGRQTLAREIHRLSTRRLRPLLLVPCATFPGDFFEQAASPAARDLREAAGGTLYLDEVADLDQGAQARLAGYLETGRVGPLRDEPLSLRVVAGTGADLPELVRRGSFRADLFHRLAVVPLELPPLRERAADVPLLLKHFARELAREHGRRPVTFALGALNALKAYAWPGNLRELRNLCERLSILLPGGTIGVDNLPAEVRSPGRTAVPNGFRLPATGIDLNLLEADVIRQALELACGNRSRAARLLGISRDTLLYRIQKHGIAA